MIRKIVLFIALAPLFVQAQTGDSQEKSNAVYKTVSKQLEDDKKLYDKLLKRFVDNDTTLTDEEMIVVYYGAVFQKNYNPYSSHKKEKEFFELYNKKEYKKAIKIGEKIIEDEPLNFKIIFKTLVCAYSLEDEKKKEKYSYYYQALLRTIINSGDGHSANTAFVVINVSDEYVFMAQLQVEFSSQSLIGVCDKFKLTDRGEEYDSDEMWFDVSQPLAQLSKMFKD